MPATGPPARSSTSSSSSAKTGTFDHVFATYEPRDGEHVDNLLSRGIIREDGSPGPNYAKAAQFSTTVNNFFSINPTPKTLQHHEQQAAGAGNLLCAAELLCHGRTGRPQWSGMPRHAAEAARGDYGLRKQDLPLLTTGATGILGNSPDTRILDSNNLPNGPYPLVTLPQGEDETSSLYKTTAAAPCTASIRCGSSSTATSPRPPSAIRVDVRPTCSRLSEMTVSSGSNGNPTPKPLKEGDIAMGFYNVARGDAPYLTQLAREYTLNDNYHQAAMGGTYANHMMIGYADELYYADQKWRSRDPNQCSGSGFESTRFSSMSREPNPAPGTNNWYANDGYGGGSYHQLLRLYPAGRRPDRQTISMRSTYRRTAARTLITCSTTMSRPYIAAAAPIRSITALHVASR